MFPTSLVSGSCAGQPAVWPGERGNPEGRTTRKAQTGQKSDSGRSSLISSKPVSGQIFVLNRDPPEDLRTTSRVGNAADSCADPNDQQQRRTKEISSTDDELTQVIVLSQTHFSKQNAVKEYQHSRDGLPARRNMLAPLFSFLYFEIAIF